MKFLSFRQKSPKNASKQPFFGGKYFQPPLKTVVLYGYSNNANASYQAFSSLTKSGKIRRVFRGVYDYPRYSQLLDRQLSPDFDQVAHALARKFNWRIQPSGDAALNLLGLSNQVPGRWVYLSDGPSREYEMGTHSLVFKKSALKDVGFKFRESGLVVQAIKALGREQVDQKVVERIRQQLGSNACDRILRDTRSVTGWIYEVIKRICKEVD